MIVWVTCIARGDGFGNRDPMSGFAFHDSNHITLLSCCGIIVACDRIGW